MSDKESELRIIDDSPKVEIFTSSNLILPKAEIFGMILSVAHSFGFEPNPTNHSERSMTRF